MAANLLGGKSSAAILITCYMCNSGLLLIFNKVAINLFPKPFELVYLQLLATWFMAALLGFCALEMKLRCSCAIVAGFWPVPVAFLALLISNLTAVQYANEHAFVAFRATTPIVLSLVEWCFLGRQLPNLRSAVCLVLMLAASLGFVFSDSFFEITDHRPVVFWYIISTVEFLVVKCVIDNVEMTTWVRNKGSRDS